LDEPPVVMEADFRNPAKSGAEREEPRLTEYLALPRRRFDVAGLRDADQLGTDGQRVADIFEQVRAECEVEEFIRERPWRLAGVVNDPGFRRHARCVLGIERFEPGFRAGLKVEDVCREVEAVTPPADVQNALRMPRQLAYARKVLPEYHPPSLLSG